MIGHKTAEIELASLDRKRAQQIENQYYLNLQTEEKARLKAAQQARDTEWVEDLEEATRRGNAIATSVAEQRALKARETAEYNRLVAEQQRAIRKRDALKDELPPRLSDDDPRCGAASLQKFDGEDILALERKRAQQNQQARWAKQMVDEKDLRKWEQKEAERMYAERLEEMTHRAWQVEQDIARHRNQRDRDQAAFNHALSQQKKDESVRSKHRETLTNMQEIQAALDSDLLTEQPDVGKHAVDQSRPRPDHMKGFTPEQRQAILNEQAAQRDDKLARKAAEKQDERAWAVWSEQQRRTAILLERQRARELRSGRRDLAAAQIQQHEERMHAPKLM